MTKMKKVLALALASVAAVVTFATPASAACGWRVYCEPKPCASANIPNVVGMDRSVALPTLFNAGFTNVLVVFMPGTPAGEIAGQNPAGGTYVVKCDQVLLTEKR